MRKRVTVRRFFFPVAMFFFWIHGFLAEANAQVTTTGAKKLSHILRSKIHTTDSLKEAVFFIAVKDLDSGRSLLESRNTRILHEYRSSGLIVASTTWEKLQAILPSNQVIFVDIQRKPKEELAVSNLDISVNKINLVHTLFPQYNGAGTVVSVKENLPDTGDIDFKGRYLSTNLSSAIFSTHASAMSTIIAGAGNSYYEGRGVAAGAIVSSAGFDILLPEPDIAYQQYNISVQNHSYGTGIENYYGPDAAAYDASVITRPSLLHIFSAGNSGPEADTAGTYKGLPGFANITGSFKMAKNSISVGHVDSSYHVLPPSSRGPAYDGRLKPELVAFAEDGSSGAAAIVSGLALVLQQTYQSLAGGLPDAALIKGILINSADDAGPTGIDYASGYGNVNGFQAIETLLKQRHFTGSVSGGQDISHILAVPAGLKQLKVTLTWSDTPAVAGAAKALVNDIDLSLALPIANQLWLPWVLSTAADTDSLMLPPVRKKDSLNNVEQITIDNPAPGNYSIGVNGFAVRSSSPQLYYIAYSFDSADVFQWYYPSQKDNIFNGRVNTIRWDCTYPEETGGLEYSLDNGNSWRIIDNAVPLSTGYFKWNAPDTFTTAVLRMHVGTRYFNSDSFSISGRFDIHVGFNCQDSFLLSWHNIQGVKDFRVYKLGQRYMESMKDVSDSFVIVNKRTNPSLYYAVSPLIDGKEGVRSYGFDYTVQGTGCYIETFFGQLTGNNATLDLRLGSVYHIKSITWQKLFSNDYKDLDEIAIIQGSNFSYTDISLSKGVNSYRVKIALDNGQLIYSDVASVYFFGSENYIVFPNPVSQNQALTILSRDFDITDVQVFNSMGMKVLELQLNSQANTIDAGRLAKGIYFLQLMKADRRQKVVKLIVY